MLECVINISEGRRHDVLDALAAAGGDAVIDRHSDPNHNRTVLTLAGDDVLESAKSVARVAIDQIDLRDHTGAHPWLGVVDVVPFIPLASDRSTDGDSMEAARAARAEFGEFAATTLGLPCFFYGDERTLPEVRRGAFVTVFPDIGPSQLDPRRGACCVGARPPLIAYNLWLAGADLTRARAIVRDIRSAALRCLAFMLDGQVQISCNLIAPDKLGPAEAYDLVAARATIDHAELVGLIPRSTLRVIPKARWSQLDLSADTTIEARITQRLNG